MFSPSVYAVQLLRFSIDITQISDVRLENDNGLRPFAGHNRGTNSRIPGVQLLFTHLEVERISRTLQFLKFMTQVRISHHDLHTPVKYAAYRCPVSR